MGWGGGELQATQRRSCSAAFVHAIISELRRGPTTTESIGSAAPCPSLRSPCDEAIHGPRHARREHPKRSYCGPRIARNDGQGIGSLISGRRPRVAATAFALSPNFCRKRVLVPFDGLGESQRVIPLQRKESATLHGADVVVDVFGTDLRKPGRISEKIPVESLLQAISRYRCSVPARR
jgi:hypothetical protein